MAGWSMAQNKALEEKGILISALKKRGIRYLSGIKGAIIVGLLLGMVTLGMPTGKTEALTFQSSVDVSFAFNTSLSVSLSSEGIHVDDLAPGTTKDSNIVTVKVLTNNLKGYTLNSSVGNTTYDSSDLVAEASNTAKFTSLNTTDSLTSLEESGETNIWGYAYLDPNLNEGTNTTWTNYSGLPLYSDTDNLANLRTTTGPSAETGDDVQFKIAAKADTTQLSGEYNNVINFAVTATPEPALEPVACNPGKICYNANSLKAVEGSMGEQAANDNTETTLIASNFSKPEYGFAGWSTTYDYSDPTGFYGPNETITTPSDVSTNGLSLYAIWVKSTGTIQNWTGCPSLSEGDVTALKDARDNQTYAVAKLADGNCWMIENLRLDAEYTRGESNKALAQGYGTSTTYGNFIGLADTENVNFNSTTPDAANNATNSLYSSDGSTTINIGTSNDPADRMPRYNNNNTNRDLTASYSGTGSSTYYQWYSYGNYYTWPAAIADTSYYNTNNQSVTNTSLCPTGWHLPLGGDKNNTTNSDFWKLSVATIGAEPANTTSNTYPSYTNNSNTEGTDASKALRAYPNNFVYSGDFSGPSAINRGSFGDYWSSTVSDNSNSYYLNLGSTNVRPGTLNGNKYYGRTVRCVISS